jgi:hypothetical protein
MKTQPRISKAQDIAPKNPPDLSAYEYPIITYQLQRMKKSEFGSDFVKGWVPQNIKGQLAFEEYLFLKKADLKIRINILDNIVTAVETGNLEGSDAFLDAVRRTLAAHLGMQSDQIFTRGENLDKISCCKKTCDEYISSHKAKFTKSARIISGL